MAETSSLRYQLIEARLKERGVVFTDFIAERRPHTSWRTIAPELEELSGVPVGHEILRRWFADRISYAVTVA
jgi:hypothetical protein